MSNLSNTILTYSKYISGYLSLYLASGKDTKNIDRGTCIMAASIGSIYAQNIYINSICAIDI